MKSYVALHWESKTRITLGRAELFSPFHHSGCCPGHSEAPEWPWFLCLTESGPSFTFDSVWHWTCSLSEGEVVGNTPVSWRKLRNWRVSTPEDNSQINHSFRAHEEKLKIRLLFWRAIVCMLRTNYAHLRGSRLQLHKRSSFDQRWSAVQWVALKSGVWESWIRFYGNDHRHFRGEEICPPLRKLIQLAFEDPGNDALTKFNWSFSE